MTKTRVALAVLLAAAAATPGCKVPEKVVSLVVRPTPTPVPTPTPTPVPAPPLKMDFVKIREERARGPEGKPGCVVEIQLEGTKRTEVGAARVVVKTAVDDLGTNLVPENAAAAPIEPVSGDNPDAPFILEVPIKLASRKAISLREVSGEIELSVRGAGGGALASVSKSLRRYRFALKDVPLP